MKTYKTCKKDYQTKAGDSIATNFEKKDLARGARIDFIKGIIAVIAVGLLMAYLVSIAI